MVMITEIWAGKSKRSLRSRMAAISGWLMVAVIWSMSCGIDPAELVAQSKPAPASIAFQLQPKQLSNSPLGEILVFENTLGREMPEFAKIIFHAEMLRGVVTLPDSIRDGTSNTIACLQGLKQVNWTQPQDLTQDEATRLYLALQPGESVIALFYDGSVRQLRAGQFSAADFRALLTPSGGEVIRSF